MFNTIEEYLEALKKEMQGKDAALTQDALADAREHLSMALEAAREKASNVSEAEALKTIIEEYGTPEETASAYGEIERRTSSSLKQVKEPNSFWSGVFNVYIDPRTWGSLLFMFITFVTGIIYFTWVVTGVSLSIGLMILIIGVPIAILFLLSVQGLALLEGRLVEALLGERMPRRPLFAQPGLKWFERLRALVTDKHTWLSMLYMLLQMPLGIVYFTLNTVLILTAVGFLLSPLRWVLLNNPNIRIQLDLIYLPDWVLYLLPIGGFILLTLTMHLVRVTGWLHGRYAKWMLVS
ncbi:MAG TPA: sensor domain-containing protein [Anaerolineales bacterium]|nr:sensor domain-containing protein [Anaerolineales bacterium]